MSFSMFFLALWILLGSLMVAIYVVSRKRRVTFSTVPDIVGLLDPRAFNLTNTFVTDNASVHKAFVKHAKSLIPTTPSKWAEVTQCASFVVQQSTPVSGYPPQSIPFHIFIQRTVFKVIMESLFGVDLADVADADVDVVAKGINDLWQLSKVSTGGDPVLLSSINFRLGKWLPDIENPLNFVIPTFETMWRVVGVTVALVLRDEHARRAVSEYLCNPTLSQFRHWPEEYHGPSVDALVRESLRLHPPTRRISRARPIFTRIASYLPTFLQPYLTQLASADIGTVHRNSHIWGPDADSFDAMRHHPSITKELSEEQFRSRERGLLAFGAGPLRCVAFNWAPQFVGVVVAAILENEGSLFKIVEGLEVGGREGWDDWKVFVGDVLNADS